MYFPAFIFACIATAGTAVRAAPAARAPSGTYTTCPAADGSGFGVGDSLLDAAGTLRCSYPAYAGEADGDFYCEYNTAVRALLSPEVEVN
jgi:hypothetical protein